MWRVLCIFVIVLSSGALLAAPVAAGCTSDCGVVAVVDDCCAPEAPADDVPGPAGTCTDCGDCLLCHVQPVPTFLMVPSMAGQQLLPVQPLVAAFTLSISMVSQVPPTPPPRA